MRGIGFWLCLALPLGGCGQSSDQSGGPPSGTNAPRAESSASKNADSKSDRQTQPQNPTSQTSRPKSFQPVDLDAAENGTEGSRSGGKTSPAETQTRQIVAALQPFQVLLGDWRWVTKKKVGDFPKTGEDLAWLWDFQTDPNHPALTLHSEAHPYLRQAWLTWQPDHDRFRFTADDATGNRRILEGTWTEGGAPADESDGKKLQRTYKLLLTQVEPDAGELWQITLIQLDNNQFLMDLKRRAAAAREFGPLDTVRQQRVGTSFAVADSDNPGPKCIISGGLGTSTVSFQGRTYPVCCSGCAAAFNDDPERWLKRLAEAAKK
ncbi:MAG: hypothetical protein ACKV0T_16970 [Planctomycetales bacterium]